MYKIVFGDLALLRRAFLDFQGWLCYHRNVKISRCSGLRKNTAGQRFAEEQKLRAQTFLEMYRVLEGLLEDKYDGEKRHSSSVVMEYINDAESEPVRRQLNLCREIRNLLTHNADAAGGAVVEPSKAVLDSLYAIIDYVQTPQPALKYATLGEQVLRTSYGEPVLLLMEKMRSRGFSHVPIIHKGGIAGVFSVSSVFSFLLEKGADALNENTRVNDFGKLVALEREYGEHFLVMPKTATYLDVRKQFEEDHTRNRRLAAVFITEDGRPSQPLLGMITPWDVMGD